MRDDQVVEVGGARLRCVRTPGHSADHVAFFEEEAGALFTGARLVHGEGPALKVFLMKHLNSLVRIFLRTHFHKGKAP